MGQLQTKEKMVWRIWPRLSFWEVPAYLEQMERKGLRFERCAFISELAQFRRIEARETVYCWDYFEPKEFVKIQLYLDMCRASGWEIAWQFGQGKVFRAIEGMTQIPLHTEEEELKSNRKKIVKSQILIPGLMYVFLGAVFYFLYLMMGAKFFLRTPLYTQMTGIFFILFCGVEAGRQLMSGLWFYLQGAEPSSSPFGVGRGIWKTGCTLLTELLFLLMCFCAMMTITEDGTSMFMWPAIVAVFLLEDLRRIGNFDEGYPKHQIMKGINHYKKKTREWVPVMVYAVVIVTIMAQLGYGSYIAYSGKNSVIQSKNLFCREVYETDGEWIRLYYYEARSEEHAKEIVESCAEEYRLETTYRYANLAEVQPSLQETLEAVGPHTVTNQPWDEIHQRGQRILIRKGSEVWVTFSENESE